MNETSTHCTFCRRTPGGERLTHVLETPHSLHPHKFQMVLGLSHSALSRWGGPVIVVIRLWEPPSGAQGAGHKVLVHRAQDSTMLTVDLTLDLVWSQLCCAV